MGRFLVAGFVCLTILAGVATGLVWWDANPSPRFRHAIDIGNGRVLTVWSTKRGGALYLDSDPLIVYYRIDAGGREVVNTTFLDHDDLGVYEFRTARAEGGRLICVYEATRAVKNPYFFLIFDAETGESWPDAWGARGGTYRQALDRWRERAARIRAEHAELPSPFDS